MLRQRLGLCVNLGKQLQTLLRLTDVGAQVASAGDVENVSAIGSKLRTVAAGGIVVALYHVQRRKGQPRLRVCGSASRALFSSLRDSAN